MNGSGVAWDGGYKLGDIGLGSAHPLYLQAGVGNDYHFTVDNLALTKFPELGVRATSTTTNVPGVLGSIKSIGHLTGDLSDDFVNNGADENGGTGFVSVTAPDQWTKVQAWDAPTPPANVSTTLEVAGGNYITAMTGNTPDNWHHNAWLDTQASPGGIDIARDFTAPVGPPPAGGYFDETFSITLALQKFTNQYGSFQTDSNESLDVFFNGTKLDTIKFSNFVDNTNTVHWNEMQTFTYHVQGLDPTGQEHVQLHDTTVQADPAGTSTLVGYVGFAVDHVDLHWQV